MEAEDDPEHDTSGSRDTGRERDPRLPRRTMLVLILGTMMSAVDATVANVALHSIGGGLGSPVGDVHWVVTAYLLAAAAAIPVSGWLARRVGARRLYIITLAVFAASSSLCAVADSLGVLVACRVLQGMASGILMPVGQLIAAEVAGPKQMSRVMSRIWMATSLGSIAGPGIGGVIVDGLGWRWIFLMNAPVGLLALIAAWRFLPSTPPRDAGRLDIAGLWRLSLGLPCLLFGLSVAARGGGSISWQTAAILLTGLVLLGDFARHSLRVENPLLNLRLYKRRVFATGALSLFFFDVAWYGALVLIPLYFQQVHGLTPALAGLLLAPQGVGTMIGLAVSGRIRNHARAAQLAVCGAIVLAGTSTLLGHLATAPYWTICLTLLAAGFAAGVAWVPATAAGYLELSVDEVSHASPLVAAVVRVGAAFGTALAAIALQVELHGHDPSVPGAQLVDAYIGSFEWIAAVSLVAAVMFFALSRSTRQRAARQGSTAGHDTCALRRTAIAGNLGSTDNQ